jgi:hypothetical protein
VENCQIGATDIKGFPIVGIFASGADVHTTHVTFEFDPAGHLMTVESAQGDTCGRFGLQ